MTTFGRSAQNLSTTHHHFEGRWHLFRLQRLDGKAAEQSAATVRLERMGEQGLAHEQGDSARSRVQLEGKFRTGPLGTDQAGEERRGERRIKGLEVDANRLTTGDLSIEPSLQTVVPVALAILRKN